MAAWAKELLFNLTLMNSILLDIKNLKIEIDELYSFGYDVHG